MPAIDIDNLRLGEKGPDEREGSVRYIVTLKATEKQSRRVEFQKRVLVREITQWPHRLL
jgi:hypothetical protein